MVCERKTEALLSEKPNPPFLNIIVMWCYVVQDKYIEGDDIRTRSSKCRHEKLLRVVTTRHVVFKSLNKNQNFEALQKKKKKEKKEKKVQNLLSSNGGRSKRDRFPRTKIDCDSWN